MHYIGAHVSAAGGAHNAVRNAVAIGANAFALFTKNQKQWKAPPLSDEQTTRFRTAMDESGFTAQQVFPWKPDGKKSAPAKYQDPESGKTWTGRGKPPNWILGKDRTLFEIK